MRDIFLESGSGPIPWDHDAVQAGATPVFDCWVLNWEREDPAACFDRLQEHVSHLSGKPLVVKINGAGKASWACVDPDTSGKASVEKVTREMGAGRFDVSNEVATFAPFAQRVNAARFQIDGVLYDDEPGSLLWQSESADPLSIANNQRIVQVQRAMFTNPRILNRLGPAARAFAPLFPEYADKGLDWFKIGRAAFDPVQCDIECLWQKMRMWGKRDLLRGVGWYPKMVLDGLTGSFSGKADNGYGWTLPTFGLYPEWFSDMFIYNDNAKDDRATCRKRTRWAFDLSKKAVRWNPTYKASDPAEDIEDRLAFCSPLDATIWVDSLDKLALHAPAIQVYCKGG